MGVSASPVSESISPTKPQKAMDGSAGVPGLKWYVRLGWLRILWAIGLLLLVPFADSHPGSAPAAYEHAHQLFLRGDLVQSQKEAAQGYAGFLTLNRAFAGKFQLLEAQDMIWRGMNEEALQVLSAKPSILKDQDAIIDALTLEGTADTYMARFEEAEQKLSQARSLCGPALDAACDRVTLRRGLLALTRGEFPEARQLFLESLSFERAQGDRRAE